MTEVFDFEVLRSLGIDVRRSLDSDLWDVSIDGTVVSGVTPEEFSREVGGWFKGPVPTELERLMADE